MIYIVICILYIVYISHIYYIFIYSYALILDGFFKSSRWKCPSYSGQNMSVNTCLCYMLVKICSAAYFAALNSNEQPH